MYLNNPIHIYVSEDDPDVIAEAKAAAEAKEVAAAVNASLEAEEPAKVEVAEAEVAETKTVEAEPVAAVETEPVEEEKTEEKVEGVPEEPAEEEKAEEKAEEVPEEPAEEEKTEEKAEEKAEEVPEEPAEEEKTEEKAEEVPEKPVEEEKTEEKAEEVPEEPAEEEKTEEKAEEASEEPVQSAGPDQDKFVSLLSEGDVVLNFDDKNKEFKSQLKDKGCTVVDATSSATMCKMAGEFTGVSVQNLIFRELREKEKYNSIYGGDSIMHLNETQLPGMLDLLASTMKSDGVLYMEYMYGVGEDSIGGVFCTRMNEDRFDKIMYRVSSLVVDEIYTTGDGDDKKLHVILKK